MNFNMLFKKNSTLISIIFFNSFFGLYIAESFIPLMSAMGKDHQGNIQLIVPTYYFGVVISQLFIGILTKYLAKIS